MKGARKTVSFDHWERRNGEGTIGFNGKATYIFKSSQVGKQFLQNFVVTTKK